MTGQPLALFVRIGLQQSLSEEAMYAWGWRVPFFIGAAASLVVLYLRRTMDEFAQPMVIDADGLNALAGAEWTGGGRLRVLTPHPGEMARLAGKSTSEIQANRVEAARAFATERQVRLVLKGHRSLIAFPDGRVWINPTGTPAMASAGSGDILTGLIASANKEVFPFAARPPFAFLICR